MLGVFDVCLVCQTSWTWYPYSSLHSQMTWIWPGWSDGLERNCLWAVSSLFSLDGLERMSCHDIWVSSELCSFCRLCIGGLDHVGSFAFEYFSHCASHPLDGVCALFVVKELDLFLDLEGMQIFGSVGSVELFFLFFLEFD